MGQVNGWVFRMVCVVWCEEWDCETEAGWGRLGAFASP